MALLSSSNHRRVSGFTLVELVSVIVLLGVVSVGTTKFISQGVGIYVDTARRDNLQQLGRFAVERVTRELRNALPGSIRTSSTAVNNCIEFLPVLAASSYLQSVAIGSDISSINIVNQDTSVANDNQLAIYTIDNASVYFAPTSLATITSVVDNGDTLTLNFAPKTFPFESPTRRIYITGSSVEFCVTDNGLRRNGVLLAESIRINDNGNTVDVFTFSSGTLQRAGIVHLDFRFADSLVPDEWVRFSQEVSVRNTP